MGKKPPIIRDNTSEEEAKIQKAIASDPTTWQTTGETVARKRGRPPGSNKTRVTVYLDNEILEQLKQPSAKGWQTRMNEVLHKAVLG